MRNLIKNILFMLMMLMLGSAYLNSQTFKIISVDPSGYPVIKAEYQAKDGAGKNIRAFDIPADFQIVDGGDTLPVDMYNCPPGISKFSLIIVIDQSQSMVQHRIDDTDPTSPLRIDAAKNAAKTWIDALDINRSECCILAFSYGVMNNPLLVHDFSVDKKDLKSSVDKKISPVGATDYNAAFLGNLLSGDKGALYYASIAKYKPIIIFITDGSHEAPDYPVGNSKFHAGEVSAEAIRLGAVIYPVTLGVVGSSISDLHSIAGATKGAVYENVTQETIQTLYQTILKNINPDDFPAPCYFQFKTTCSGGNLEATMMPPKGAPSSATFTYKIPDSLKPSLIYTMQDPVFYNVDPAKSEYKDIVVNITTKNNYVELTGSISSNPRFQILGSLPPKIDKNQTIQVTVRYTPTDSICQSTQIELVGTECTEKYLLASGGFVFPKNTDLGNAKKDTTVNVTVTAQICNWTCKPVKIDDVQLQGGDVGEISIKKGIKPKDIIPANTCIDVEFTFHPTKVGTRTTNMVIKAAGMTLQSVVSGNGVGLAGINPNPNPCVFQNIDCATPTRQQVINIQNPGASALNITKFEIMPDNTDFDFVGGNPGQLTVPPLGTKPITIEFKSTTKGPKTGTLRMTSNAEGFTTKDVPLSGIRDDVSITTSVSTLDFGTICPDSIATKVITLTNKSTLQVKVNGDVQAPFTLPVNSWDMVKDANQDVRINYSNNAEGTFNQTLTFTDELCQTKNIITLTGKVAAPHLSANPASIAISTTFGKCDSTTLTITNTSDRDLDITQLLPQDNIQFKISSPKTPVKVAAKSSIDIVVKYCPTSTDAVNTKLQINGSPCNFNTTVDLTGNPGKAIADIFIDTNYRQIKGGDIDVKLELRNMIQVVESGAKTISTTVTYDPTVLTPKNHTPTTPGTLDLKNLTHNNTNNNQVIATIQFHVEPSGTANLSALKATQAQDDKTAVQFFEKDGLFTVLESKATIELFPMKAKPGEIFDLTFYMNKTQNVKPLIQISFATEISFDATLMEPLPPAPTGTVDANGIRTIYFDSIPVIEAATQTVTRAYKFRAMLGRVNSTTVQINPAKTKVRNGEIIFDIKPADFTLLGVCQTNGSDRLFDPYGTAALPGIIQIKPNPTGSMTEVDYLTIEEGISKLWITDLLGIKALELTTESMKPGEYTINFDASVFNSGVYYLILQTPTQTFTKSMTIVK